MKALSTEEIEFTRKCILENLRVDLRKMNDERETVFMESTIEQSDGHLHVVRGETEIEVSIRFIETEETLFTLERIENDTTESSIAPESSKTLDSSNIESNEFFLNLIQETLKEFLKNYKIGVKVEAVIFKDDGCVFDLFFLALQKIFSCINIPIIENLDRLDIFCDIETSLDLPKPKTYAVYENIFVLDPNKNEELSSDGIIHLLVDSSKNIHGMFLENSKLIDPLVLIEAINNSV
ncbi:hypothetical protein LUQ84_001321 [Hamiltosporidium tvaerminnensis]|nr:hypothetical protein LUQ84_001321 [Hamiltosporidium tvaerminnensis]